MIAQRLQKGQKALRASLEQQVLQVQMAPPVPKGKMGLLARPGLKVPLAPKVKLEQLLLKAIQDCLVLQDTMGLWAKKDTQVKKVQRVHGAPKARRVQQVQMDRRAMQANQERMVLRERLVSLALKEHLVPLVHGDLQAELVLRDQQVLRDHPDHQDLQAIGVMREQAETSESPGLRGLLANLAKTASKEQVGNADHLEKVVPQGLQALLGLLAVMVKQAKMGCQGHLALKVRLALPGWVALMVIMDNQVRVNQERRGLLGCLVNQETTLSLAL